MSCTRAPDGLLDKPLGDDTQLDVLLLADPGEPVEGFLFAHAGPAAQNADRLIDHRSAAKRAVQMLGAVPSLASSWALYTDTAAGPANCEAQRHGVLGEGVAVARIRIDRSDHLVVDDQWQRQHGMHTHPCDTSTEMWPAAVTSE